MPNLLRNRSLIKTLLIGLCLVHLGFLFYVIAIFYPIYIHSDAAAAPLLAQEILASGQLIPEGWYHVNSDVWILNRQMLILPYVWLFGQGQLAYLAMQLSFVVLCVASCLYVLRPILSRPSHLFVATCFMAVPFSVQFYFHNYGEIAYGPILLVMFLSASLVARAATARQPVSLALVLLFGLTFLVAASSPSRHIAYILMPVVLTFGVLWAARLRWISVIGVMLAALVLGRVWNQALLSDLYRSHRGSGYTLQNPLDWPGDLFDVLKGMFDLIDLVAWSGPGGWGLWVLSALYTLVLLGGTIWAARILWRKAMHLFETRRLADPKWLYRNIFILCALFSLLAVIGALVVTNAPEDARIFLPPFFMLGFVLFAIFTPLAFRNARVGLFYLILLSVPILFELNFRIPFHREQDTLALAEKLKSHGVEFGYATNFWRANQTTLVSDGAVTLRPVRFRDNLIYPYRGLAHRDWFLRRDIDRFGILARKGHELDIARLVEFGVNHIKSVDIDGAQLHVFDGHQALFKLPKWPGDDQRMTDHPLVAASDVGQRARDDRGHYLQNTGTGLLVKSIDLPLRQGRYAVTIDVSCDDTARATARFQAESLETPILLGDICAPGQTLPGVFELTTPHNILRGGVTVTAEAGTLRFYGLSLQ